MIYCGDTFIVCITHDEGPCPVFNSKWVRWIVNQDMEKAASAAGILHTQTYMVFVRTLSVVGVSTELILTSMIAAS
jgi:hypothetical protein